MKLLPIRLLADVFKRTIKEIGEDEVGILAAALTYYAIFSIVPLLILIVTVATLLVNNPEAARQTVFQQVSGFAPGETAKVVSDIVDGALKNRASGGTILAAIVSLAGLLLSASGVFGTLDKAINRAWGCEYKESFVKDKLISFAMVMGVALVMLLSLVVSSFLTFAQTNANGAGQLLGLGDKVMAFVWQIVSILISILLSATILLVIFRMLPRCGVRVREVWFGALFTALLWEILKQGFAFYLGNFANNTSLYGTFGALFSLLTWIYLTGFILLVGAEFTSEYANALRKFERVADVDEDGKEKPAPRLSPSARAWRGPPAGAAEEAR